MRWPIPLMITGLAIFVAVFITVVVWHYMDEKAGDDSETKGSSIIIVTVTGTWGMRNSTPAMEVMTE